MTDSTERAARELEFNAQSTVLGYIKAKPNYSNQKSQFFHSQFPAIRRLCLGRERVFVWGEREALEGRTWKAEMRRLELLAVG